MQTTTYRGPSSSALAWILTSWFLLQLAVAAKQQAPLHPMCVRKPSCSNLAQKTLEQVAEICCSATSEMSPRDTLRSIWATCPYLLRKVSFVVDAPSTASYRDLKSQYKAKSHNESRVFNLLIETMLKGKLVYLAICLLKCHKPKHCTFPSICIFTQTYCNSFPAQLKLTFGLNGQYAKA